MRMRDWSSDVCASDLRVAGNRLASTLTVVDGGVEGVEGRRQMVQTGGGKGLIVAVERIVEHGSLLLSALARSKGRRRPFLPPPCGGGALRRTGGQRRGRGRRPPRSCSFPDLFLDFVRRGEAICAGQNGGPPLGFCQPRPCCQGQ